MKSIIVLILILFTNTFLEGQELVKNTKDQKMMHNSEIGTFRLNGVIQDSTTQAPIPFANISIKNTLSNVIYKYSVTDENGSFLIDNLQLDNKYLLSISSIGYQNKAVKIENNQEKLTIILKQNVKLLNEVRVTAKIDIVEEKIDRIIYHADKDLLQQNSSLDDMLRKVPMVDVSLDGKIFVRGSSKIKILIDGKTTSIGGGDPSEVIKQIPSESVKDIEVITSPPAKYDADGGIVINIVTKKKTIQGFGTNINIGVGVKGSNSSSSVSYANKRISISGSLFGNWFYNKSDGSIEVLPKQGNSFYANSSGNLKIGAMNAQLSANYKVSSKDNIQLSYNNRNRKLNSYRFTDYTLGVSEKYTTDINTQVKSKNQDISFEYTHQFGKVQHELSVSVQNGFNPNNTFFSSKRSNEILLLANDSYNKETIFQIDYQNPFSRKATFETGIKLIHRTMNNYPQDAISGISSDFTFLQNIGASYLSYHQELKKKWSVKAGVRFEKTYHDLTFGSQQSMNNYSNLFPNIIVYKKLKNAKSLKFAFNQRIQRPAINYLNPNTSLNDMVNSYNGNPFIKPEIINNYEIGFNTNFKLGSMIFSGFYRNGHNVISSYNIVKEQIISSSVINLLKQNDFGINIFSSIKPLKNWQNSINGNVYYNILTGGENIHFLKNEGFAYTLSLMSSYSINNVWSFQFFGGFNSDKVRLQGKEPGFSFSNFGIRQNFKNKSGSITLGIDNPFSNKIRLVSQNTTDDFRFISTTTLYARGIRLMLNYKFGKYEMKPESSKKDKKTSDLKVEDSGI